MKTDNPFYYNYLFSAEDIKRCTIKKWRYPLLFFLPTYVATADGYAYFYKRWDGKIYLMKYEDLVDSTESEAP